MPTTDLNPAAYRAVFSSRGFYNILCALALVLPASSALPIADLPPLHSLGNVFGATVWHGFFGGPIAYRILGRKPFSTLQEVRPLPLSLVTLPHS